jgi:hypothetical protein
MKYILDCDDLNLNANNEEAAVVVTLSTIIHASYLVQNDEVVNTEAIKPKTG